MALFKKVLNSYGLDDCHDSKSVLTSGKISFSKENKTTMIMMVSVSSILFNFAFLLVAKMVYDYDTSFLYSTFTIFKETIYNLIIAGILFKPMLLLAEIINKSKNSYYLL